MRFRWMAGSVFSVQCSEFLPIVRCALAKRNDWLELKFHASPRR